MNTDFMPHPSDPSGRVTLTLRYAPSVEVELSTASWHAKVKVYRIRRAAGFIRIHRSSRVRSFRLRRRSSPNLGLDELFRRDGILRDRPWEHATPRLLLILVNILVKKGIRGGARNCLRLRRGGICSLNDTWRSRSEDDTPCA